MAVAVAVAGAEIAAQGGAGWAWGVDTGVVWAGAIGWAAVRIGAEAIIQYGDGIVTAAVVVIVPTIGVGAGDLALTGVGVGRRSTLIIWLWVIFRAFHVHSMIHL